MSSLTCRIIFVDPAPTRATADVYVRLEDVSLSDAAAILVAQTVVRQLSIPAVGPLEVTFAVDRRRLEPRRHYSLRVHIDRDGDGQVTPGDYVSTKSYPIRGEDLDGGLQVEVRRVG